MTRRSILSLLVAGAGLLVGGVVGIPALVAGFSPVFKRRQTPTWRPVGRLDDFSVGKVSAGFVPIDRAVWPRSFSQQLVFVWRRDAQEVVVFSRSCTDLGCPLNYDPGSGCFLCPCHGGIFGPTGDRLAGPPSAPLLRYSHRVRDGVLEIDLLSIPPAA
jgi:menaquinol-cytochrome c reductase iron-sulfur subunit